MEDISHKIEVTKKRPMTVENLNYIGDLYLKKGDKQTAIAYFYESAEKLHISQKDKKLAIYKKIINISTSESRAYENIISIFSKMGLVAEEKKYIVLLANLYQNKGELNKLDALHRRIKEIESEDHHEEQYYAQGRQYDDGFLRKHDDRGRIEISPDADDMIEDALPGTADSGTDGQTAPPAYAGDMSRPAAGRDMELRRRSVRDFSGSGSSEGLRKYLSLIAAAFLLILLALSIYLYKGMKGRHETAFIPKEVVSKTGSFDINISRLKDMKELAGRIAEHEQKANDFYAMTIKARISCIDDAFVAAPQGRISLTGRDGRKIPLHAVQGLEDLTRTIYRTNACSGNAGAVFMKIIFAEAGKTEFTGISLEGLEKDGPVFIPWD